MNRVIHFEIHVDDLQRASKFFGDVFGWTFQKWDGPQEYWLISTGDPKSPGIDGGMMKRLDPAGAVYNTIEVPAIDEYIERVKVHGGVICVPKMAIPGVGWLAYFKDTEGNVHGIMQSDANAR